MWGRLIAINFTDEPLTGFGISGIIEVSTDRAREGLEFAGTLGPNEAVVLRHRQ
jgi:hypothetical protein